MSSGIQIDCNLITVLFFEPHSDYNVITDRSLSRPQGYKVTKDTIMSPYGYIWAIYMRARIEM